MGVRAQVCQHQLAQPVGLHGLDIAVDPRIGCRLQGAQRCHGFQLRLQLCHGVAELGALIAAQAQTHAFGSECGNDGDLAVKQLHDDGQSPGAKRVKLWLNRRKAQAGLQGHLAHCIERIVVLAPLRGNADAFTRCVELVVACHAEHGIQPARLLHGGGHFSSGVHGCAPVLANEVLRLKASRRRPPWYRHSMARRCCS